MGVSIENLRQRLRLCGPWDLRRATLSRDRGALRRANDDYHQHDYDNHHASADNHDYHYNYHHDDDIYNDVDIDNQHNDIMPAM